jgi:hypothetical protein
LQNKLLQLICNELLDGNVAAIEPLFGSNPLPPISSVQAVAQQLLAEGLLVNMQPATPVPAQTAAAAAAAAAGEATILAKVRTPERPPPAFATPAAAATAAGAPIQRKKPQPASGDAAFKKQLGKEIEEFVQMVLGGQAGLRDMGSADLQLLGLSNEQARQALGSRSFMRMPVGKKLVSNLSALSTGDEDVVVTLMYCCTLRSMYCHVSSPRWHLSSESGGNPALPMLLLLLPCRTLW